MSPIHQKEKNHMTRTFAARLKTLREQGVLSQHDLEDRAGLARDTLSSLEDGSQQPSWATVEALATALEVATDVFRISTGTEAPACQLAVVPVDHKHVAMFIPIETDESAVCDSGLADDEVPGVQCRVELRRQLKFAKEWKVASAPLAWARVYVYRFRRDVGFVDGIAEVRCMDVLSTTRPRRCARLLGWTIQARWPEVWLGEDYDMLARRSPVKARTKGKKKRRQKS
jgi:transcriptional regulator with XRE-family HTH domain